MNYRVQLLKVLGAFAEFADLIGNEGILCLHESSNDKELNWFNPDNSGDSLTLSRKAINQHGLTIEVCTRLGSVFIFKIIPYAVKLISTDEPEFYDLIDLPGELQLVSPDKVDLNWYDPLDGSGKILIDKWNILDEDRIEAFALISGERMRFKVI